MKRFVQIYLIDLLFPLVVWAAFLVTSLVKSSYIFYFNYLLKNMGESVYLGLIIPGGLMVWPTLIVLWISNILFFIFSMKKRILKIIYIQGLIPIVTLLSVVMYGKYLRLMKTLKLEEHDYTLIDVIKLYWNNSKSSEMFFLYHLLISFIIFLIIKYFLVKTLSSTPP